MATQPTNVGIDYQQRVSAWVTINMLIEMDLNISFKLGCETYIRKVEFESEDIIDDLVVTTTNNEKIFFQMKRTASLTIGEDTDFYKAIFQFVKDFAVNGAEDRKYVLVTSSHTSKPVKESLRKILDSVRLNPTTFIENPLTKSESESYTKFKNLIENIFLNVRGKPISDTEYQSLITKIYIQVLDVEDGMQFERAILLTIQNKVNHKAPEEFWALAIKSCLSLASQRMSVTKESIQEIWKPFMMENKEGAVSEKSFLEEFLQFETEGQFPTGRDVILAQSLNSIPSLMINPDESQNERTDHGNTLFIIELHRFDDNGNKKLNYCNEDTLILGADWKLKVICRTATVTGMNRFLEENPDLLQKEIVIIEANETDFIEQNEYVKAYRTKCIHLAKSNRSFKCLHCSRGVSQNHSYIVEIDDFDDEPIIGLIHDDCRRPIDRILGIVQAELFEEYDFLVNFDYEGWLLELQESQAFIGGISQVNHVENFVVMWNPYNYPNNSLNYCVKINLKNGDFRYSKIRGKVDRLNKSEAKRIAKTFNESFQKNTWCYTTKSNLFSIYDEVIKMKRIDEDIVECLSAEMVRYNDQIGKQHNDFRNYYAPLCFITLLEDESIFEIHGMPILVSNPFDLKYLIANWKDAGIELEDFEINILYTDLDFDNFMKDLVSRNLRPILNPSVDNKGNIVNGIVIRPKNDFIK